MAEVSKGRTVGARGVAVPAQRQEHHQRSAECEPVATARQAGPAQAKGRTAHRGIELSEPLGQHLGRGSCMRSREASCGANFVVQQRTVSYLTSTPRSSTPEDRGEAHLQPDGPCE